MMAVRARRCPPVHTLRSVVWGRFATRGVFSYRPFESAASVVASVLIAMMVAITGIAVQVTSATTLPGGASAPRLVLDVDDNPEGSAIYRTPPPEPDPMIWCRTLKGSTICVREST